MRASTNEESCLRSRQLDPLGMPITWRFPTKEDTAVEHGQEGKLGRQNRCLDTSSLSSSVFPAPPRKGFIHENLGRAKEART